MEARVRESFAKQAFMRTIGASMTHVAAGEVDLRLRVRDDLTQQHGFVHAGAVASIADSACGYAALTLMPEGAGVLTVEYKINLMAPAAGQELIARGRVVRAGKTLTVCEARVAAVRDGEERDIAILVSTIMTIRDRGAIVD